VAGTGILALGIAMAGHFSTGRYYPPLALFMAIAFTRGGAFNPIFTVSSCVLDPERDVAACLALTTAQVIGAILGLLLGTWFTPITGPAHNFLLSDFLA
jgi:hypothetical protein